MLPTRQINLLLDIIEMILALHLSLGQLKKRGEGGFLKSLIITFKSQNIKQKYYMLMHGASGEV